MQRLLIVSNRLPVTIEKDGGGFNFRHSVGGLATGLESFYKSYESIWVGWPGLSKEGVGKNKAELQRKLLSEYRCQPVFLSNEDVRDYYHGFSNNTLWPLSHYFIQYVTYDEKNWESYRHVNELFCESVVDIASENDMIWIHDYHLMLLPGLIREKLPEATIGYFHHIPFPSFEIFRLLPWRSTILKGLTGADLIGFHTSDYTRHFLSSMHRLLGHDHSLGQINVGDRIIKVDTFPMGIDYERFSEVERDPEVKKEVKTFKKNLHGRRVILSIDRLDYSKGIPQRLEAISTFLERFPEYREKVVFIMVASPSRELVEHYRSIKKEVNELIGSINGEHGVIGWVPIWYIHRSLPFSNLAALYRIADVYLVTPLRDGMNLMAKEYIASIKDGKGVLILSEMAGAEKELGEAIIVNPNNKEKMVEALDQALKMPEKKQVEGNKVMQERIKRYNVVRWSQDFIEGILSTKSIQREMRAKILTPELKEMLIKEYTNAKKRLLLIDYDGTLTPFFDRPEDARPEKDLLSLLEGIAGDPKNEMVIISGRDRDTLEKWFGGIKMPLVAEHGVSIKEIDGEWEMIEPLTTEWKDEVRPILELYVDRTPGAMIEEKEFSLVWHYRKADIELSSMRVRELIDELVTLTANLNLQILEGNKVVEMKNVSINKGRTALRWISRGGYDFILAIGDDWTDEDVFDVLPKDAYSIKVGLKSSLAKFNLENHKDVISFLHSLDSRG